MPNGAHTVLIWNIETYGWPMSRGDYSGLHAFIAHVICATGAEALMIEEFKSSGEARIGALVNELGPLPGKSGPIWSYDFIPGALATPYTLGDDIDIGDLNWGSNSEGYAVVWKDTVLSALGAEGQSAGANGDPAKGRYLALSLQGVDPGIEPRQPNHFTWEGGQITEDDLIASGYPISTSPILVVEAGKKSVRLAIDYDEEAEKALRKIMRSERCRRPCYCRFEFKTGVKGTIMAYHTPVKGTAPVYAVQLCGLSAQVVLKNAPEYEKLILGGDFNLMSSSDIRTCFTNFEQFGMTNSDPVNPFKQSSVHYVSQECLAGKDNVANFLGSPRDQILHREKKFSSPKGGVFDVLAELRSNGSFAKTILADHDIRDMVDKNRPHKLPPPGNSNWDTAYANLKQCFVDKQFDSYLSCAMLFRGYISDHMPLFQSFNR